MIRNIDKKTYKLIIFCGIVLAIVLKIDIISKLFKNLLSVLSPIIVGIIIAFIMNILVDFWEIKLLNKSKSPIVRKLKRPLSMLISIITIIIFSLIVLRIIIPQLTESIFIFSDSFPNFINTVKSSLEKYFSNIYSLSTELSKFNLDAKEILQKLFNIISSWSGGIFSILGSFFSIVTNLVMGIIIAIYIVASKETLKRQFNKLIYKFLPEKFIEKFYYVLNVSNDTFKAFIVGQFTEAIILGVLCTIGLWIFKFPYAPMIGSVVGLTSLIPLVGAYIGGIFGFIMILTVNPVRAFLFLLFLIILQQIEGNIIYPRVVGNSVGLPGLWVMVAIVLGGGLFGINGILFGLPILATVYKILKEYINS